MIIEDLFNFELEEPFNSNAFFSNIYNLKHDFYRKEYKNRRIPEYDMEKDPDYIKILQLEKEYLLNNINKLDIDEIEFCYLVPYDKVCYTIYDHMDREVHFIDNDFDNADWYNFYTYYERQKDIKNHIELRKKQLRKEKISKINGIKS